MPVFNYALVTAQSSTDAVQLLFVKLMYDRNVLGPIETISAEGFQLFESAHFNLNMCRRGQVF